MNTTTKPTKDVAALTLAEQIEETQRQLKLLKDQHKELNKKEKKVNKGTPCTFQNKAGETITGLGVLYYVVNLNGKLHYKEASKVTVLDKLPA